jgi:NhaP-type Na+/H+ or K+/H+ antiporter
LLTILLGGLAAMVTFRQPSLWQAGILGAILAPTDAGLGQITVASPRVPAGIREAKPRGPKPTHASGHWS